MKNTQEILLGDVFENLKKLPEKSIHCVTTSPAFYRLRKYSEKNTLQEQLEFGREESPDCGGWMRDENCGKCYICKTQLLFLELKKVLHPSGIIYYNIGDSYFSESKPAWGMQPGDQMGIPFRVFLAIQKLGFIGRQHLIWAKGISGFGTKSGWCGSCMPESVKSRWNNSHEYVLMFTLSKDYFFDYIAVQEDSAYPPGTRESKKKGSFNSKYKNNDSARPGDESFRFISEKRNHRSVFTTEKNQTTLEHCAVFPPGLIEPLIKSATSEKGCCSKCLTPIKRKVEVVGKEITQAMKVAGCDSTGFYEGDPTKDFYQAKAQNPADSKRSILNSMSKVKKSTWVAGCSCGAEAIPCTVLDPFAGSGTTLLVAKKLGVSAIGIELNLEYKKMIETRLAQQEGKAEIVVEPEEKVELKEIQHEFSEIVDEYFWEFI